MKYDNKIQHKSFLRQAKYLGLRVIGASLIAITKGIVRVLFRIEAAVNATMKEILAGLRVVLLALIGIIRAIGVTFRFFKFILKRFAFVWSGYDHATKALVERGMAGGQALARWLKSPRGMARAGAVPADRSPTYEALMRRTFGDEAPRLAQERAVLFVPQPFQETFEHPSGRVDADRKSFTVTVLGPLGLCIGILTLVVGGVTLALSTGLYIPGSHSAAKASSEVPRRLLPGGSVSGPTR
jgi:hypothetical protein